MLQRMSAKDFRDWEIYAGLEPFGELRADYRAAQIAQMVFNMAVASKHRKSLKDFILPTEDREEVAPVRQDQFALMKLLASAYAGSTPSVAEGEQDREVSAAMREQVKRAHEAMKDT